MTASFDAGVIAAFGRHLLVRDTSGQEHRARAFGRRLSIVCGDQVRCETDTRHEQVHVVAVLPRRSVLYRSSAQGNAEAVVANLTRLLVVLAPLPEPDFFVIDRYIAAASSAGIAITLVLNKTDLGVDAALAAEIATYGDIGYTSINCSAHADDGAAALLGACAGATAALVGQSGVGKSSLVRRLLPDADVTVGELATEDEGRHTTSSARLFDLPNGGHLIDSPGVRDFAPAVAQLDPGDLGFVEIGRAAAGCRFNDCHHVREPGCAVLAAVDGGSIAARRYRSFKRLRNIYDALNEARGPGRGPRSAH